MIYNIWWGCMITCVLKLFKSKFYNTLQLAHLEDFLVFINCQKHEWNTLTGTYVARMDTDGSN